MPGRGARLRVRLRMYQSETRSIPSGLACTASTTTSSRMRSVSGSSRLTSCHTVSISCCAPSTSVACSPPSIHTTARPSAASRAAWRSPPAPGQRAADLPQPLQPPVVLRRGDDGHVLRAPLLGAADVHQRHPVALGGEPLPVRGEMLVVGEHVVGPDRWPNCCLRRGEARLCVCAGGASQQQGERQDGGAADPVRRDQGPGLLAGEIAAVSPTIGSAPRRCQPAASSPASSSAAASLPGSRSTSAVGPARSTRPPS
jgi:hypothetical protein